MKLVPIMEVRSSELAMDHWMEWLNWIFHIDIRSDIGYIVRQDIKLELEEHEN